MSYEANESENGMIRCGEFSIPRFIEAYACDEVGGHEYMTAVAKWRNCFNIIEAYKIANGDISFFNAKLARAIIENGIDYFENGERIHAAKAYRTLLVLDRCYYNVTGRHFKGYVKCDTIEETMQYLSRFDDAYDEYICGGHVEFEDR